MNTSTLTTLLNGFRYCIDILRDHLQFVLTARDRISDSDTRPAHKELRDQLHAEARRRIRDIIRYEMELVELEIEYNR